MKQTLILAVVVLMACSVAQAQTTVAPPLINYQGRLTGPDGKGLEGTRNLELNIYDAASGGARLWGPKSFDNVPLIDGHFNLILGNSNSGYSIAYIFTGPDRYLGIKVDGGTEISPRQRILSAPYALQTEKASHHSNVIPVGTIVAFYGKTAPVGWLLCNGTQIPSGNDYQALRTLLGGNLVPDLRGVFLRGWDNDRGIDWPRGLGTFQTDAIKYHYHIYDDRYYSDSTEANWGSIGSKYTDNDNAPTHTYRSYTGTAGDAEETRPMNVAVNFIIKY